MEKELLLFQDESEDAILARIQEESLRFYNEVELPRRAAVDVQCENEPGCFPEPHCSKVQPDSSHLTPVKDVFYKKRGHGAEGFHLAAGETFVYPTNYPIRKYQKNIIVSALFNNTLVSLPTGLGKTFIAAVVMFNYFRWFPEGKIVFMAPTRPLVAQQIRACHDIMAIPVGDTVEMTGSMNPMDRSKNWKCKRVFFLTPQVMANDIRSGICPAKFFKCVVIDEAHKATKEYAYCHVIKELEKAGAVLRVLALSATPGSNIKAVIEVVQNLRISKLELRSEDSPDVIPYTHTKRIEPISLCLSKDIIKFRERFLMIYEKYLKNLRDSRFVTCNVQNVSKFQLLKLSEKMRSRRPPGMTKERMGVLMSDFTVCMTLAHGLDLLQTYGLRAFYQYFTGCEDEENRKAAFTRLRQDEAFLQVIDSVHSYVSSPMDQFWSHPKHEQLVRILKDHFSESENTERCLSKVIIFCQYRVVVSELYELLNQIHPLIKPVRFIGQGVGKGNTGLPQKKQMEIMKQFREGKSNVLIATCVAEEGLDIGSVDLLILMEVQRSPVRLVQRLGRTGRHRTGRCVVLLTQGKEVQKFDEAMASSKTFLNNIQKSKLLIDNLYKDDPRMIPPEFVPKMLLVHINVPERVTPGKNKKQSSIRQALMSTHLTEIVEDGESPFLSEEQLDCNKEELGTYQINFTSLSFILCSEYLYPMMNSCAIDMEELFKPTFCQMSEYNDWNRCSQQTYLLSHSSDSEILCHLLKNAESMQLRHYSDDGFQVCLNSGSMNVNKPLKNKIKNNKEVVKKTIIGNGEKINMDIRQCMAVISDNVQNSQDKYFKKPVPIDESVVVYDDCAEQNSNPLFKQENYINYKNQSKEHSCLLFKLTDLNSKPEHLDEPIIHKELSLTLSNIIKVNKLVKHLTKEIINDINVATLFNIKSNNCLLQEDKPSAYEMNKPYSVKHNMLYTKVDNICTLEENSTNNIKITKPIENISVSQQYHENNTGEYFNFDDIFSVENELWNNGEIQHNNKTSTPNDKVNKYHSFNPLDNSEHKINKLENCNLINSEIFVTNALSNSSFITPKCELSFKIADPSSISNFALDDVALISPESPVLSGQVIPSVAPKILAKGSTSFFKHNYPILEPDSDTSPSIKRVCHPPDLNVNKSTQILHKAHHVSTIQLFQEDCASITDKEDILDQSSMYTVTQLVENVIGPKENVKPQKDIHVMGGSKETKQTHNIFNNSSDSLEFQNIDSPSISNNHANPKESKGPDLHIKSGSSSLLETRNISKVASSSNYMLGEKYFATNHPTALAKNSPNIKHCGDNGNYFIEFLKSSSNKSCILDKEIPQTSSVHSDVKELFNVQSDSDESSDVFVHQENKLNQMGTLQKDNKNRKIKKNLFIEMEADVSGTVNSSDEDITSDFDDLEESFINDLTELPNSSVDPGSDIQARYLQSVKHPRENPGGFKIPKMTNSMLAMDVYSQLGEEEDNEDDTYVNDSFCCDATEIPIIEEPSLLDIAEEILKSKKRKKRRRIHLSSDSSPDDHNVNTKKKRVSLKFKNDLKSPIGKSMAQSSSDIESTCKHINECSLNSESSPDCLRLNVNVKRKMKHLLTSSDSDVTL